MKRNILALAMASTALFTSTAFAEDITLTIESWRNDDLALWQEKIIPAFEASHPGIKVKFTPSAPTEYNAVLNSKHNSLAAIPFGLVRFLRGVWGDHPGLFGEGKVWVARLIVIPKIAIARESSGNGDLLAFPIEVGDRPAGDRLN